MAAEALRSPPGRRAQRRRYMRLKEGLETLWCHCRPRGPFVAACGPDSHATSLNGLLHLFKWLQIFFYDRADPYGLLISCYRLPAGN